MISSSVRLHVFDDNRGKLVVLESNNHVPFDIKRVFYIYDTSEDINRGMHAHYKTRQFLVAVHGKCKITLDDGQTRKTYDLDSPDVGLFQDAMIWGTMHNFSEDCVLMVLADRLYDSVDYIADYKKFIAIAKG